MTVVSVKDKVIVITGGGRGLGKAYAEALAGDDARVVVAEIRDADGEAVVEGIKKAGGQAIFVHTDVSNFKQCEDMAKAAVETYGRVDVLVNNAALYFETQFRPFFTITDEEWDRHMAVDVKGTWNCCKAVVPQMIKQGKGHIVNIASTVTLQGIPLFLDYTTAKGAILGITRGLSKEMPYLSDAEITVNAIAPGLVYTEASLVKGGSELAYAVNEMSRSIKRKCMSKDLVGAIYFLCSDASDYITGQVLPVDGGIYCI